MDLRFGDGKPTDEEREAVDALLGPPESSWEGAARDGTDAADLRWARGGREARDRRDQLLPALHALNDRVGWISEGALDYVCRRLTVPPAEAYGVATFYAMFSVRPRPATVLHVCTDLACTAAGASGLCTAVEARLGPESGVKVERSPCLGLCERAPAALVVRAGESALPAQGDLPARPAFEDEAVRAESGGPGAAAPGDGKGKGRRGRKTLHATAVCAPATPDRAVAAATAPETAPAEPAPALAVPQTGDPTLTLLHRIGTTDPASLDDYRAHGGYTALRRAFALGPAAVIREVTTPVWSAAAAPPSPPAASGRRRPPSPTTRTTWSATPTNPNPAPSRTASSWRATRTPWSRP
ncbi:NADH-quinone oxidoreductase chain 2 [Streptomyces sp. MH60]|nr:NADH-quinone oxidoreductase chain 2 [Streptomyces sp. MH60]